MKSGSAKHARTYLHGLSLGPWLDLDMRAHGLLDLPERAAVATPEDFVFELAVGTVRELLPAALRAVVPWHPERKDILERAAGSCETAHDLVSARKAAIAAAQAAYEAQPSEYVRRAVPDASSTRVPHLAHEAAVWAAHAAQERRAGRIVAAAYAAVAAGHCVSVASGSDASAQLLEGIGRVCSDAVWANKAVADEAPSRPALGMSM